MPTSVANPKQCIVLTNPEHVASNVQDMLDCSWSVQRVSDPLRAMAELAVCERAEAARAGWGLQRAVSIVLAIEQPPELPEVAAMLRAVRRYLPNVSIMTCTDNVLQSVAGQPQGSTTCKHATEDAEAMRNENAAPSISREELDMLLNDSGDHDR